MIDSAFVASFFPMMDQQRPARFYRPKDELAEGATDKLWFRATVRKETFSVDEMVAFAGSSLQGVTQVYSILDASAPQVYKLCRIYDEKEKSWFSVVSDARTASDALQTVYCSALKQGLTPQLAKTGG